MRPGGRNPLSASSSHSYPTVPVPSVAVAPAAWVATEVPRQNRSLPSAAGTRRLTVPELTLKIVPVSRFSGRPPSAGGLNRGSRQVPVQVGGSCGSMTALAWVSLYVTSVRYGVPDPSVLFSQRVFQNTSLPLKNARFTPASRAASTLARCLPDQYSSWPTDRNALWLRSSCPPGRSGVSKSVSAPEE